MYQILAIDDDPIFLSSLSKLLKYQNYTVDATSNPFDALNLLKTKEYHCVLLDVQMPGRDGISLLQKIKREHTSLPIIMISGKSTLMMGMNAIKEGAFDFLEKGGDLDRLLLSLKNAIRHKELLAERTALLHSLYAQVKICANSPAMQRVLQQINDFGLTNSPVLITGETGTGKEMVAQMLYLKSAYVFKPYLKINCACCSPEKQIETVLDVSTGENTINREDGPAQWTQGGTLFLNEIGALSRALQERIVRHLETNGKVWLIAASNKNLQQMASENRFDKTLLRILQEQHIRLPSLRERTEDIPALTAHFLEEFSAMYNKPIQGVTEQALQILRETSWPENVRMLKKVVEKAVQLSSDERISAKEIELALTFFRQFESASSSTRLNFTKLLDHFNKQQN